jgi:hypothetical protein
LTTLRGVAVPGVLVPAGSFVVLRIAHLLDASTVRL